MRRSNVSRWALNRRAKHAGKPGPC